MSLYLSAPVKITVAAGETEKFKIETCWWFRIVPAEQPVPAQFSIDKPGDAGGIVKLTGEFYAPPVAHNDFKYRSTTLTLYGGENGSSFVIYWAQSR